MKMETVFLDWWQKQSQHFGLFLVALGQIRESNIIRESMTNKTVRLIVIRLDFRMFQYCEIFVIKLIKLLDYCS